MDLYDDFTKLFGKLQDEFEEAVAEFISNYEDYVADAKKHLGKLFDKKNYPPKSQLHDLFKATIETDNLPDIDDVRLNLTAEDLLDIEKTAVGDIADKWSKIQKMLIDRMTNYKAILGAGGVSDDMKNRINEDVKLLEEAEVFDNDSSKFSVDASIAIEAVKEALEAQGVKVSKSLDTEVVDESSMMIADDDMDLDDLDNFGIN
jgi:hypothetical protein